MGFSWWHFGAAIASLISAVFFILGIVGTKEGWFEYKVQGATITSGNFGGCVKYTGCNACEFWKDRNENGTDPSDLACNYFTTNQWKPPSKWVNGGYVAIVCCVIGLIITLICVVLSCLMMFGLLRGMKGSVITMLAVCVLLSLLAWIVFLACVRTAHWKEAVPPGGDIDLSKKMAVKFSFILTILAGIAAVAGIVFTALAPGKNQ